MTPQTSTSAQVFQAFAGRLGRVTVEELREATGLHREQMRWALKTLQRRGFIRQQANGSWKLTSEGAQALGAGADFRPGPKGPSLTANDPTSFRSRLWRALRVSRKGTIADLLILAAAPKDQNPALSAKEFLCALARAGLVGRLVRKGIGTKYVLIRDPGPQTPQLNKRQKRLFDPNTNTTYDLSEAPHVG